MKLMMIEDDKHHQADGVVASYEKIAERLDHLAGCVGAVLTLEQNDAGRGHVEGQAQQRGQQQNRGEHGKIQRPDGVQRRQQHDHRHRDVEGKQHIERQSGQRKHHHGQNQQHQHRPRQTA